MKITTANIDLPAGKTDAVFLDNVLRGFGVRVRLLSGDRIGRSFIIQYRVGGRSRRMIIGDASVLTVPQARDKARKLLAQVQLGGDPQGDQKQGRERDAMTLRHIITEYLANKEIAATRKGTPVKASTLRVARAYLTERPFLKPLHSSPVDRITGADVARAVLAASKAGAQTAVCFRSTLNAMFIWAVGAGLCEANPLVGAVKAQQPPPRDRVLSDQELASIWKALDGDEFGEYRWIVRLLMLTGGRMMEVGAMRWSEFAEDGATWTLPKERSKTGKVHTLPVTDAMKSVLDKVIPYEGRDFLFGSRSASGFTDWSRMKNLLDEKLDLPHWTLRDIRRSVSTSMNDHGFAPPHVIEKILNHALPGVHRIYNRSDYRAEVAAAMKAWSAHISEITSGKPRDRNIVPMHRSAASA